MFKWVDRANETDYFNICVSLTNIKSSFVATKKEKGKLTLTRRFPICYQALVNFSVDFKNQELFGKDFWLFFSSCFPSLTDEFPSDKSTWSRRQYGHDKDTSLWPGGRARASILPQCEATASQKEHLLAETTRSPAQNRKEGMWQYSGSQGFRLVVAHRDQQILCLTTQKAKHRAAQWQPPMSSFMLAPLASSPYQTLNLSFK